MPKSTRDEREATGTLGAYAIGGLGLASARGFYGLLGEGRSSLHDLGPMPIGSDPWLRSEVLAAIARAIGVDATTLTVEAHEAVVTLGGSAPADDLRRIESAARTVQGMKSLRVAIDPR